MNLYQVMTTDVITVGPETPIHKAARLMVDHGVSGLPVVDDDGKLVGIISEGDLILRQKGREPVSWWRAFFADGERLAREYQKAAGTTVGEVMSRPVISVSPALTIEIAAAMMHQCGIRRLPLVVNGQLVGIVSRSDLIKALATAPPRTCACVTKSDQDLAAAMRARMADEPWAASANVVVDAHDGILTLLGTAETDATKSALETMARSIGGCLSVNDQLVVQSPHAPYRYGI